MAKSHFFRWRTRAALPAICKSFAVIRPRRTFPPRYCFKKRLKKPDIACGAYSFICEANNVESVFNNSAFAGKRGFITAFRVKSRGIRYRRCRRLRLRGSGKKRSREIWSDRWWQSVSDQSQPSDIRNTKNRREIQGWGHERAYAWNKSGSRNRCA